MFFEYVKITKAVRGSFRLLRRTRLFLVLPLLFGGVLRGQPELNLIEVVSGLSQPTDIAATAALPNLLFVAQKTGTVRIIDLSTGSILPAPYTSVAGEISTNSERGLLGMAFDPEFATNRTFYLHFSADGDGSLSRGTSVIRRYVVDNVQAPSASATLSTVLTLEQDFANHNGGDLAFGPDAYLYVGFGDGGDGGDPNDRGQQRSSLLGKMLRIDVRNPPEDNTYSIPADNPFVADVATRDEIWALGLRNPWRFSFDRLTGDLWIGDVGQNAREEVNFQPADSSGGENYGWDCKEGTRDFGGASDECTPSLVLTDPVAEFTHSNPTEANSVTGGFVYRGADWPDLFGTYVCADFVTNRFFLIRPDGDDGWMVTQQSGLGVDRVSTFGESANGELFLADFGGRLFRVGGGEPSAIRDDHNGLSFNVYPNPVLRSGSLFISGLEEERGYVVDIFDNKGRRLLSRRVNAPALLLPEAIPPGVYWLRISGGARTGTRKIIVR